MIWWVVDHINLVILLLVAAAVVLVAAWWSTRKQPLLIALAAVGALIVAAWVLAQVVVTDRMRLTATVQEMAQAVQERNLDRLFGKISSTFQHAGMDRARFRDYVKAQLDSHRIQAFHVEKFDFPGIVDRTAGRGQIEFWVYVVAPQIEDIPIRCEAEFNFEGQEWRLQGFKVFVGRSPNELRLPSGRW
jgi:hypothetical protein